MTAIYAQPTPDENLVSGWNVQGNVNPGGETGYAQAANTTTSFGPGQPGAGFPLPAGAMNANPSENSGAYSESILTNPGYADSLGPATRTLPATIGGVSLTAPTVAATGVVATNPSTVFPALVTISGGTVTVVKVGTAGQTYAQATQVGTGDGTYTVPPGGVIGTTNSVAPTWTWAV